MNLLDRYIARQYLINVIALFAILFSFVVMIDLSVNFDRFADAGLDYSIARGDEDPNFFKHTYLTIFMVYDLWWPRLVQLFGFMLGVVLVGAMGFTTAQLSRNRELLAILAAGQSLHRLIRPVLIVACGLTVVQAVNQELLVPKVAPLLGRDHGDIGQPIVSVDAVELVSDGDRLRLRADEFDADRGTLTGVFAMIVDETGRAEAIVRASGATWEGGGWRLENPVTEPRQPGAPTDLTFLDTPLDPVRLRTQRDATFRQALSFTQAGEILEHGDLLDPRTEAELTRVRFGRFTVMLANLLAIIIVSPFFLNRQPDGLLQRTLRGTPIAMLALMGGVLGSSAAIPGLPPALSVFLPVAILAPVAVTAISSVKT
ncbi:MAG: LptF/LptG family permease [Planctomycetota bacterium]